MIEIENLSKAFQVAKRKNGMFRTFLSNEKETIHALSNVSFKMDEGEIVGYIGPNGAGKSTTIKIMSGILVPTSGSCSIMGNTPWKSRVQHVKNIGVVFGQRTQLWWDVPVIDSFNLLKDIYKMSDQLYKESLSELVDALDISNLLNMPARQLSLGQRMRCEIAASLLHRPKILFLDEPTIGLDAVSKLAVRQFIQHINKTQGVTVVLTTHDMSDIEALANRIILIGKGKKLYDGSLEKLKSDYITTKRIVVDYNDQQPILSPSGCKIIHAQEGRTVLEINLNETSVPEVISTLSHNANIADLTVESEPVESLIIKLYKEHAI